MARRSTRSLKTQASTQRRDSKGRFSDGGGGGGDKIKLAFTPRKRKRKSLSSIGVFDQRKLDFASKRARRSFLGGSRSKS